MPKCRPVCRSRKQTRKIRSKSSKNFVDEVWEKRERLERKMERAYKKWRGKNGTHADMDKYHIARSNLEKFNDNWRGC